MGKKRRLGQLEAAAAPPQLAEVPAPSTVEKGEVEYEEVMHKRRKKKKKREEVMEMQSRVIEQCGDGDVEKIEPPKKKEKSSEVKDAVANGVADARQKKKRKKLSAWKKQAEAKWKESVEVRRTQVCSKEKVAERPNPINCSDVCVICRLKGHLISTCPLLSQTEDSNEKSGNKLPDCPQPLQDVDLKNGKAEKLLGCPLVETL